MRVSEALRESGFGSWSLPPLEQPAATVICRFQYLGGCNGVIVGRRPVVVKGRVHRCNFIVTLKRAAEMVASGQIRDPEGLLQRQS